MRIASYFHSGINLFLVKKRCSTADVASFDNDGLKFGLIRMTGGYFWLLQTGLYTSDAPYSPLLEVPSNRGLPWNVGHLGPNTRATVGIHLIDGTGITRAIKLMTVSPQFTQKLESIHLNSLKTDGFTGAGWNAEITRFYARYPTPKAAMRQASITCMGGQ